MPQAPDDYARLHEYALPNKSERFFTGGMQRMRTIRRLLTLILTALILASLIPATVYALQQDAEPTTPLSVEESNLTEGETEPIPFETSDEIADESHDTQTTDDEQLDMALLQEEAEDNQELIIIPPITRQFSEIMPLAALGAWTEYGRPGHSSASGDSVSFRGHEQVPFTTLLFQAASDGDYRVLTFHLTEGLSDWHTLEGSGFMFNCGINGGMLNGYAVLFGQSNVGFYKLTNVNVTALASTTLTSIPGVTLIDQKPKPAFSKGTSWYLKLVMSPGTLKVEKYADVIFTQLTETIFSTTLNDTSGGSGYGPFASFVSHNCSVISTSTLEYFNLTITPNTPPVLNAPDVTLNRGAVFSVMDGVRANDAEDGDLTAAVTVISSNVNVQVPGVYQVTYTVSDLAGANVNHSRKVTVLADVLYLVTDAKTKAPIQGVGIMMNAPAGSLSNTDVSGKTSVAAVPPGTYQWEVMKQHEDYLPLTGKHSVQIDNTSTSSWPMVIPIELTKKFHDAGVALSLSKINEEAVKNGDTAKYNQIVTFSLTITNYSNQAVIPAIELKASDGIALTGHARHTGNALEPGASETVEVECKVTSLGDALTATLEATVVGLALADTKASVPDENPENDKAIAKLDIKNQPVIFAKTDTLSKKALDGAEFQILSGDAPIKLKKQDNGSWLVDEHGVATISSSSGGKMTIYGLSPGKYSIKETKQLPGYALPSAQWSFEIGEDGAVVGTLALTNEPTVLELTKTDKLTKALLADVKFKLLDKDGKTVKMLKQDGYYAPNEKGEETCATDAAGKIVIKYLPVGSYTLAEQPHAGYIPLVDQKFEIKDSHTEKSPFKLSLENTPTALLLVKTDATNGKPIDGAVFKLTGPDDKPILLTRQQDGTYRPDTNGKETFTVQKGLVTIFYLPAGKLKLTEVTPPVGFSAAKPVDLEITDKYSVDTPLKVTVSDYPLAMLIKKLSRDRTPLNGAGFTLTRADSVSPLSFTRDEKGVFRYDPSGSITTVMVSGSGEALMYCIPEGEYMLEESVVPEGYVHAVSRRIKVMAEDNAEKPLEVVIINEPIVKLGFDFDRWFLPVAFGLFALAAVTGGVAFIYQRKKARAG